VVFPWETCHTSAKATGENHLLRTPSRWRDGCYPGRRQSRAAWAKYGIKNPIFKPSPITPNYNKYMICEGISVDEWGQAILISGRSHRLSAGVSERRSKSDQGSATRRKKPTRSSAPRPCKDTFGGGRHSKCLRDAWLHADIFDSNSCRAAAGPTKHIKGGVDYQRRPTSKVRKYSDRGVARRTYCRQRRAVRGILEARRISPRLARSAGTDDLSLVR